MSWQRMGGKPQRRVFMSEPGARQHLRKLHGGREDLAPMAWTKLERARLGAWSAMSTAPPPERVAARKRTEGRAQAMLGLLEATGVELRTSDWLDLARDLGISRASFYRYVGQLTAAGMVAKAGGEYRSLRPEGERAPVLD